VLREEPLSEVEANRPTTHLDTGRQDKDSNQNQQ
jgi:hypothetical protein